MNCLTDYIGLRGCGTTAPPSGLWLNDLPGMSLKQVVALTNEEEATWNDIWQMIQRRAASRFTLDVREAMGKHYRLKSLVQGINMPKQLDQPQASTAANAGDQVGVVIQLNESADWQYVPSPLTSIHVQQVHFYGAAAEKIDLVIRDPYTNTILYQRYNIVLTDDWNTLEVNQTFNAQALAIIVSPSVSDPLSAYYHSEAPYSHQVPGCCDVSVKGFYTDDLSKILQSTTANAYGVAVTFTLGCSWENLICANKSLFSRPWWYLLGIEMLTETLYSSKLNQYTTVNLQRNKELREEYQVEYSKALEQIAGGFDLSCDCCIDCSGGVQLRESTSFY